MEENKQDRCLSVRLEKNPVFRFDQHSTRFYLDKENFQLNYIGAINVSILGSYRTYIEHDKNLQQHQYNY